MPSKKHKPADILKGNHGALSGADKFVARPLVEVRPDLVPDVLRPVKNYKSEPFDVSFISETPKTITIRHRDGEILTVKKVPYAEVVARIKREKAAMKRRKKSTVDTSPAGK